MGGDSCIVGTVNLVDCRFARSWSRWPSDVAMEAGKKRVMFVMLIPSQVRKFPFLIVRRKVRGVGLKQHPCRYLINSVYVLSLMMMASALCSKGFLIGMSQSPSSGFLWPCITDQFSAHARLFTMLFLQLLKMKPRVHSAMLKKVSLLFPLSSVLVTNNLLPSKNRKLHHWWFCKL